MRLPPILTSSTTTFSTSTFSTSSSSNSIVSPPLATAATAIRSSQPPPPRSHHPAYHPAPHSTNPRTLTPTHPPFPTLSEFLLRQRALHLYRAIVRATNRIPRTSATRAELKSYAREEFERVRGVAAGSRDARVLVERGEREFERVRGWLG